VAGLFDSRGAKGRLVYGPGRHGGDLAVFGGSDCRLDAGEGGTPGKDAPSSGFEGGRIDDLEVEKGGFLGHVVELLNDLGGRGEVAFLGGYGEYVTEPDEIGPAIQRAFDSGLPACVNVIMDARPPGVEGGYSFM